jgi:thiol-disulfide isomerase/thioredoxin
MDCARKAKVTAGRPSRLRSEIARTLAFGTFAAGVACSNDTRPRAQAPQDVPVRNPVLAIPVAAPSVPGPAGLALEVVPADAGLAAIQAAPLAPQAAPLASLLLLAAPAEGDVLSIVRAGRVHALEQKRTFVVYVGASWCPPCVRFHEALKNGELAQSLAHYTLMQFDLDRDGQRLLAAGYGSKFIPFFVLPGPDGRKSQSFEVKVLRKQEALAEIEAGLLGFRR